MFLIIMVLYLEFILLRYLFILSFFFFFSSRRRHTRLVSDWSSDVCSSDLGHEHRIAGVQNEFPAAPEPDCTAAAPQAHTETQVHNAVGEMPAGSLDTHRLDRKSVG